MTEELNVDNSGVPIATKQARADEPQAGAGNSLADGVEMPLEAQTALAKFAVARRNLGIMIVLTLINVVLAFIDSNYEFAFSACLPSLFIYLAKCCENVVETGIAYVLSVGVILSFCASWLFCVFRPCWLVFALLVFLADSVALFGLCANVGDEDIPWISLAFHIWVLYYCGIIFIISANMSTNILSVLIFNIFSFNNFVSKKLLELSVHNCCIIGKEGK